jgi:hypothetical protein
MAEISEKLQEIIRKYSDALLLSQIKLAQIDVNEGNKGYLLALLTEKNLRGLK